MSAQRCFYSGCSRFADNVCNGCHRAVYCSISCQHNDWGMHRHECQHEFGTRTATERASATNRSILIGDDEEDSEDEMFGDGLRMDAATEGDARSTRGAALETTSSHGSVPSTLVYEYVFDDASSTHSGSSAAHDVARLRWLDRGDSTLHVEPAHGGPAQNTHAPARRGSISSSTASCNDVAEEMDEARPGDTECAPSQCVPVYETVGELVYDAHRGCYVDSNGTPVYNIDTGSARLDAPREHGARVRLVMRCDGAQDLP